MARQPIFMVSMLSVALLMPAGLASAQTKLSQSVAAEGPAAARRLAPKDRLQIDVAGRGGFQGAAEVQEDGLIFLPFGSVRAKGRTPSELADQIAKVVKDSGLVAEPVVTVELIQGENR